MPTPAETLAQSLQALRDAKRFSHTSNSYRKDNPGEYAKVIAYLDGGTRPTGVVTEMGQHALLEEDARRVLNVVEPPPPQGASLDRFTAFKNNSFGPDTAYPGSGAIFNRKCDPTPSGNGFLNQAVVCPRPWSDEWSGIFEVDIPGVGKGLDFRFGSAMPRSSGKGIQIADIGHLIPRSLPADFGFSWDFMFPAAGNPNGFPPFSGDPSTDEWNVLWEFTDAGFQSNAIGIANFVAPKPRLYVTAGNGIDGQKRRAKSSFLLAMDTWYSLRYEGRLSRGSDGRVKLQAGLRGQPMETIADWSGPVSNPADGDPYIEFGLYGMNVAGRNQVIYANLRNLRG